MSYSLTAGAAPSSMSDKVEEYLLRPGLTAAIGTVAARFTVMPEGSVTIFNRDVPVVVAAAGALYVASLVSALTHDYVLPLVNKSEKFGSAASLVNPALTGGASILAWSAANPNAVAEKGSATLFAIGSISEIASQWVYEKGIKPLMG